MHGSRLLYDLFLQVQQLTTDISLILDSLRASGVVEVKVISQAVSLSRTLSLLFAGYCTMFRSPYLYCKKQHPICNYISEFV